MLGLQLTVVGPGRKVPPPPLLLLPMPPSPYCHWAHFLALGWHSFRSEWPCIINLLIINKLILYCTSPSWPSGFAYPLFYSLQSRQRYPTQLQDSLAPL